MNYQLTDHFIFDLMGILPEVWLLCMSLVVLLVGVLLKNAHTFLYRLSQFSLIGVFVITFLGENNTSYHFNKMWVADSLSYVLKLCISFLTFWFLMYAKPHLDKLLYKEFYPLVLFSVLGMMIMTSAQSLLVLYLGLETLSLSLYTLIALNRDDLEASEAAMKYFLLGALASGILLYGFSFIYGLTGSLDISYLSAEHVRQENLIVLMLSVVLIVSAIGFKLGVVPFQMWVPDVYQGSPTIVTAFLASIVKLASFAFVFRLLVNGLGDLSLYWQNILLIMGVLSITVGNIVALAQTNLKRMLAYSTISHMGFLCYGFMSATNNGYTSAIFYILVYVLINLATFGIVLYLLSLKNYQVRNIGDLQGLNKTNPLLALSILIVMFSQAGIPPTLGFYAKFVVLQSALQAGFVYAVIFAVVMAVIGAFYYLRIVKLVYFDPPIQENMPANGIKMYPVVINSFALLVLGILPQGLMTLSYFASESFL